jgi:hypothetical protein
MRRLRDAPLKRRDSRDSGILPLPPRQRERARIYRSKKAQAGSDSTDAGE